MDTQVESKLDVIGQITVTCREYKVSYRKDSAPKEKVTSSRGAAEYLRNVWSEDMEYREEFYVLMMSRSNKILGHSCVSAGGVTGTVADMKVIFQHALKANACAIILAHNHPSGNLRPSEADIALTKKAVSAGKVLDLCVLDHLILTEDNYYSFADEGMI